jgi:hypothetical protein
MVVKQFGSYVDDLRTKQRHKHNKHTGEKLTVSQLRDTRSERERQHRIHVTMAAHHVLTGGGHRPDQPSEYQQQQQQQQQLQQLQQPSGSVVQEGDPKNGHISKSSGKKHHHHHHQHSTPNATTHVSSSVSDRVTNADRQANWRQRDKIAWNAFDAAFEPHQSPTQLVNLQVLQTSFSNNAHGEMDKKDMVSGDHMSSSDLEEEEEEDLESAPVSRPSSRNGQSTEVAGSSSLLASFRNLTDSTNTTTNTKYWNLVHVMAMGQHSKIRASDKMNSFHWTFLPMTKRARFSMLHASLYHLYTQFQQDYLTSESRREMLRKRVFQSSPVPGPSGQASHDPFFDGIFGGSSGPGNNGDGGRDTKLAQVQESPNETEATSSSSGPNGERLDASGLPESQYDWIREIRSQMTLLKLPHLSHQQKLYHRSTRKFEGLGVKQIQPVPPKPLPYIPSDQLGERRRLYALVDQHNRTVQQEESEKQMDSGLASYLLQKTNHYKSMQKRHNERMAMTDRHSQSQYQKKKKKKQQKKQQRKAHNRRQAAARKPATTRGPASTWTIMIDQAVNDSMMSSTNPPVVSDQQQQQVRDQQNEDAVVEESVSEGDDDGELQQVFDGGIPPIHKPMYRPARFKKARKKPVKPVDPSLTFMSVKGSRTQRVRKPQGKPRVGLVLLKGNIQGLSK